MVVAINYKKTSRALFEMNCCKGLAGAKRAKMAGYKIPEEPVDEAKYVDTLDKKRIESAFYHRVSRAEARVGFGQHRAFVV